MSKKMQITLHSIMGAILLTLLIIATFYDEAISDITYVGTAMSYIGAVIGKLPAWMLLAFASGVLFRGATNKEKRYKARLPLMICYMVLMLFATFMMGYSIVEDVLGGVMKYLISGLICVLGFVATMVIAKIIPLDYVTRLRKWSMMAIFCIFVVLVLTLGMKLVWGRMRYADIVGGGVAFTPWYKPQGFTGGSSMPSGHVALASCMFLLPMLFLSIPNIKQYASSMYLLACIYTVFIAFTRIMGGFHFVSDVTISIIIAYSTINITFACGYGKRLSNTMLSDRNWLNRF